VYIIVEEGITNIKEIVTMAMYEVSFNSASGKKRVRTNLEFTSKTQATAYADNLNKQFSNKNARVVKGGKKK